ncbi:hypothetical protein MACK_003325 [Theileria orientalis]|uniref:histone acetyltransferase n=1 Tax=Theileria orientalis TaxID=68886 RepID=A0A976SII8_THEOR|nr:hypothetical protein MACK_003325 [Theileria orientalis]
MDSLKSTALIPGEPEYKTEFNLLNMLLMKIPKHVDLRLILNAKPLQPRHTVALQQLHSELFPIRYDPKFFEVACSTDSGIFDTQSFWDFFDSSPNDTRDLDWYENQIMSFGIFLPRTYVSFFRRTGEYAIDKYLEFLVKDADYNEFDDPLTESLLYDHECDEFMIGFVTLLINMEETNNLISGDDYNILRTFYRNQLCPLIYNIDPKEDHIYGTMNSNCADKEDDSSFMDVESDMDRMNSIDDVAVDVTNSADVSDTRDNIGTDVKENIGIYAKENSVHIDVSLVTANNTTETDANNTTGTGTANNNTTGIDSTDIKDDVHPPSVDGMDHMSGIDKEEMERKIRSSIRINESLLCDNFYVFLYNQLYNNELIMEYVRNFNIKDAKSVYILSTGITLGLRKRMLGTHVILFVQLLIYYINYNIYVYENNYYKISYPLMKKVNYKDLTPQEKEAKRNMGIMRNYYNSKFISMKDMYVYYTHVLNLGNVPLSMANFITKVNESELNRVDLNGKYNTSTVNSNLTSSSNSNSMKNSNSIKNSNNNNNNNNNNTNNNNTPNGVTNDPVTKNITPNSSVTVDANSLNASKNNANEDVSMANGTINDVYNKMPLVIYLHTIYYNEYATKVYEHLNFYRIKSITDYYNINNKRYDANFLAHYLCM